jgi:uncharacterized protein
MGGHDEKDKYIVRSQDGVGDAFEDVIERRMTRRAFLKTVTIASSVMIAGGSLALGETAAAATNPGPVFTKIDPTAPEYDDVVVAEGYFARTLIRWGDPMFADSPDFDVWNQTPEAQAKQFGYNCDFVGFLPLPLGSTSSNRGLLVVNHEYTNEELMFPKYNPKGPTETQVSIALQAHGVSVVEIALTRDGWQVVRDSKYNRRLTATSPMTIAGPAAGHAWLKTSADPNGSTILGTLNNCAAGKTPWGTVVTAEENFHQYFAHLKYLDKADPRAAVHTRYGMPAESSERGWELYHSRFDVSREPNEPFRHGWCVEIDPYDPTSTPVKHTALGRFRHEAATFAIAPSNQVVAYMGDDAQFEYVYKFVSKNRYNPRDRKAAMRLLDEGTLYVARFNDDGSGEWLPLVSGQGPLTAESGFASQGDIALNTRVAADKVGATKMDRPEDVEMNPVNKRIYVLCTNNANRGAANRAGPDKANPRAANRSGHIIEIIEEGNNPTATTFRWEMFLIAGTPDDPTTYFAGYDKSQVSPIGAVDNIAFDMMGNAWVATDGAASAIKLNDGLFAVPTEGTDRGKVQQFFSTVRGSEVCGPEFTPDNRTLFLAIQHPGEGGTFEKPLTTWPDRAGQAKPSVITVQAYDSRRIGS